jgi:hypothetical protein
MKFAINKPDGTTEFREATAIDCKGQDRTSELLDQYRDKVREGAFYLKVDERDFEQIEMTINSYNEMEASKKSVFDEILKEKGQEEAAKAEAEFYAAFSPGGKYEGQSDNILDALEEIREKRFPGRYLEELKNKEISGRIAQYAADNAAIGNDGTTVPVDDYDFTAGETLEIAELTDDRAELTAAEKEALASMAHDLWRDRCPPHQNTNVSVPYRQLSDDAKNVFRNIVEIGLAVNRELLTGEISKESLISKHLPGKARYYLPGNVTGIVDEEIKTEDAFFDDRKNQWYCTDQKKAQEAFKQIERKLPDFKSIVKELQNLGKETAHEM